LPLPAVKVVLLNCLSAGAPDSALSPAINLFPETADIVPGAKMIRVTRINSAPMILNSDLIEHIEETPDTVIALTTGQSLRVRETAEELVTRIIDFRRNIQSQASSPPPLHTLV
jgi:flagellar protein FlbD